MNKLQWNFKRMSFILFQENPFQNVVWEWRPFCLGLNALTPHPLLPSELHGPLVGLGGPERWIYCASDIRYGQNGKLVVVIITYHDCNILQSLFQVIDTNNTHVEGHRMGHSVSSIACHCYNRTDKITLGKVLKVHIKYRLKVKQF